MTDPAHPLPPHNIEAEKCLLGSLIRDPDRLADVACIVGADSFFREAHKAMFQAILDTREHHGAVDNVLIKEQIEAGRYFADPAKGVRLIGDVAATLLTEVSDTAADGCHAIHYAEIVAKLAQQRETWAADHQWRIALQSGDATAQAEAFERLQKAQAALQHARQVAPATTPYIPFPTDALPDPVGRFVSEAAGAIGCDPAFVALPLLSGLASAIGNTRRIVLKHGWTEPAILWTACIGESGTHKSPAQDVALRAIRQRQADAMKRYEEAMELYEQDRVRYERDLADWRKNKSAGEPPTKPQEPVAERFVVSDTTVESLALILHGQNPPRGLLLARDELAGWLNSFDRYAGGKGADAAHWIELYGGRPMLVDRKSSSPKIIHIARASVSVTGGIQPDTLRAALGHEHFADGLAARLLPAMPDRKARRWSEAQVAPEIEAAVADIFKRLYELQFSMDADGNAVPVDVPLSTDGKAAWIAFVNEHGTELNELTGDLAAAWSKLEGAAARLALIVHFIRWADDDLTLADADTVDAASIGAGVALAKWFGGEAKRIYGTLAETDEQRQRRELVDLIRRKGGKITVRELMQASRHYRSDSETAELALAGLVKDGLANREMVMPGDKGGRPTEVFVLTVYGNTTTEKP